MLVLEVEPVVDGEKTREKSTGNHFATLLSPAQLPALLSSATMASYAIWQLPHLTDFGATLTFEAFIFFSGELAFLKSLHNAAAFPASRLCKWKHLI